MRYEVVCANDKNHKGPFFSTFVVANLLGDGSRLSDKGRVVRRKPIEDYCEKCLETAVFRAVDEFRVLVRGKYAPKG